MASTFWARTDSGSANNPALNLTGDPAVEIKFVQAGAAGELVLDVAGGSVDPDTQVEIGGSTYNFTFELSGFMPTLKKDGAQQVPDQFEGHAVYIVAVRDYPTAGETTRLSFFAGRPCDTSRDGRFRQRRDRRTECRHDIRGCSLLCSRNAYSNVQGGHPCRRLAGGRLCFDFGS